jgi:hypothetical protein
MIFKSLGHVKTQDIVTSKIDNISKQVYNEIQSDNLFTIASEPADVRDYIDDVLRHTWKMTQIYFKKGKDRVFTSKLQQQRSQAVKLFKERSSINFHSNLNCIRLV